MSVLLSSCCCTGSDPCDTDWNFWDCCSGRRMFDDPNSALPPSMKSTLGVLTSFRRMPSGPFGLPATGNRQIFLDALPSQMTCVGGLLNYGEPYPLNYDYFGAKAGNWGPAPGSGNEYVRESLLRAYGSQFPNGWPGLPFRMYSANADRDDILNGLVSPIDTGSFDRLELKMGGPQGCLASGCSPVTSGFIRVSSSTGYVSPFGIKFTFNRGTTKDDGLDSSCAPVGGSWPDFCDQCPQDVTPATSVRVSLMTADYKPPSFVKGNACGIPANIQALIESSNPGQISDGWFIRGDFCSGGTGYFGGCTQGWYANTCEEVTTTERGTIYAGYGECSCCPEDWDDKEISIQVIT
mgnify:CR=1 FL=1